MDGTTEPNAGNGSDDVVNPSFFDDATADSADGNETDRGPYGHGYFPDGRPRKRRPRARGNNRTAASSTKKKDNLDLAAIEGILLNVHAMLAAMLKNPVWALNDAEAHQLAQATTGVARHYNLPDVAPAVADHINFGIALIAIYGPRIAANKVNNANEQMRKEQQSLDPTTSTSLMKVVNGIDGFPATEN